MMRIGIYLESSMHGPLGGAQTFAAVLAQSLSTAHKVDLIVRDPNFSLEELARGSSTDLTSVSMSVTGRAGKDEFGLPVIDGSYDVFIAIVHNAPPICPAKRGVLMVLFPLSRDRYWPWSRSDSTRWLRRFARETYHARRWRQRLGAYQTRTAISEFTRLWTKRRWGIDTTVIYPPVDVTEPLLESPQKKDVISSVGRFTPEGLSKNQKELLTAYRALRGRPGFDWAYRCVGAVSATEASQLYFQECQLMARGTGAEVIANLDRLQIRSLYAQSRIFWHAAGYTHDEAGSPENSEHFGIATVEAMAHGAVPIVIRRGGQPEIVQHGDSGLLWNTLEELQDYTASLSADPHRLAQMSGAAIEQSKRFSREHFARQVSSLLSPLVS